MDGEQRRNSAALGINATDQMARALGRDHDDVDVVRRLDGLEVNAEAVRDAQHFAGMEVRLDLRLVEFALGLVGREDLDPVGALGGLIGRDHDHAVGFGLLSGGPVGVEATITLYPLSRRFWAWAWPWLPYPRIAMVLPFSAFGFASFS